MAYTETLFCVFCVVSSAKDNKRIIYCICEYEPLLDSSNMTINDYARLATDIMVSHLKDSVLVTHLD
jgi:arginase family enzyme